jgi:hypothetical protein
LGAVLVLFPRDPDHTASVVARMIALQEDSLQGGIVVRRFEPFGRTPEARVWWLDGEPILVSAHLDTPEDAPQPDVDAVVPAVKRLGCRFVTTDLAQRADGEWRVVEVGDGQVSDLPATVEPGQLLDHLR